MHERFRVLHLSTWKERCGIAGYAESLVGALATRGIEGDVHRFDRRRTKYFTRSDMESYLNTFVEAARSFDLIHIQHEFSFFAGGGDLTDANRHFFGLMRTLNRLNRPVVVTFHTEPYFVPAESRRQRIRRTLTLREPPLAWAAERVFRQGRPVRALVHAQKSRLSLIRNGCNPETVRVIPMGVDDRRPELYRESRAAAKARLGLPNDAVVLSLFGFVAAYKGHEVAVQALKRLPDRFVLAVVGGPHPEGGDATVDRILRLWAKRDSNRLRITGFVDPPTRDLYQMATDVCLAPYTEGNLASSAGITWGLSSGRPVVASAIPSFRELNEKSSALELVTPGCPAELAWTVQRLITNPARTAELVRNALDYSSQCSWDVVAREVSQIYGELVGRTVGQEPELAKKESHAPFPRLVQAA